MATNLLLSDDEHAKLVGVLLTHKNALAFAIQMANAMEVTQHPQLKEAVKDLEVINSIYRKLQI